MSLTQCEYLHTVVMGGVSIDTSSIYVIIVVIIVVNTTIVFVWMVCNFVIILSFYDIFI